MHQSIMTSEVLSPSTVMGAVATGFASFVREKGAEVEDIFERSALHPGAMSNPNQPISLPAFLKAVDTAAQVIDEDNFGLWFGNQFRPEYLGLWGYLGLSSATLGEALTNMTHYFPVFQSQSSLKLSHSQGKIKLEYGLLDGRIVNRRHDAEMTLGNVLNVMRRALGDTWAPLEVSFNHARPEHWQEHLKAFRTDVRFGQESNSMLFSASDLVKPMPGADPQLLLIARQSFDALQVSNSLRIKFSEQVRSEIIEVIHSGVPRVECIAERLGLPAWTLNRRLKEEGYSFTGLFESVRRDLSRYYLENTSVSISKLAELLGYTETSSFTHAFNRWFDVSPKRWRDYQRGAPEHSER